MTAKEYLKQYEEAKRRSSRLQKEYNAQQNMIDAIRSSSDFDGMPRNRSGGKSSVENKIIRLAEKAAALKDAEIQELEIRQEIFETINKIPGDEGAVLYERYISLEENEHSIAPKRWEKIAIDMNYSWSGIHKLHRRALHLVSEIIGA